MSLIHKALKKAEHESRGDMPDMSQVVTPEEELIDNKKKLSSTSLTPRTIVLVVLAMFAVGFFAYNNFIKDKKGTPRPKTPPKVETTPAAPQAGTQAVSPGVPATPTQPTIPGVTTVSGAGVAGAVPGVAGASGGAAAAQAKELPDEAKRLEKEGEDQFALGNLDGALVRFNEALNQAANSPEILNSIGLVYKKKGDVDSAKSYYEKALSFDPDCAECLNNLGVIGVEKGDNISAVFYFKKAIESSKEYADPYFNLAVLMEKEGNIKSAIDYYKKFLKFSTLEDEVLREKIRTRVEQLALEGEEAE